MLHLRSLAVLALATAFASACSGSDTPDMTGGDSGVTNPGNDATTNVTPDSGVTQDQRDATTNTDPDSGVNNEPDSGTIAQCTDLTVFEDVDMDSYGVSGTTMDVCLRPGEEVAGYSRQAGDCRANDPWANPTADEICNDHVDDNCDSADQACPTTQTASIDVPSWDCVSGTPPANVYAYALFTNGGGYYQANGCFVFFEGLLNEFYVQRMNVNRVNQAASCSQIDGCVCPSDSGWPSYDRRLYAWTLAGTPDSCAEIRVIDHGGETQPVSNDCRKYLYQLHYYDIPYSYIAGSEASMDRRLSLFPTVEIACASEQYQQLPFRTLLTAAVTRNPGFVKKQ
jgi:hypothetical protein